MTTRVELSRQELADLKAFTKQADDAAAVRSAMTEYLRFARRMELKAMSDRIEMAANWQSLETSEMGDTHEVHG